MGVLKAGAARSLPGQPRQSAGMQQVINALSRNLNLMLSFVCYFERKKERKSTDNPLLLVGSS